MLNQDLYDKLKQVFGTVAVSHEGVAMISRACTRAVVLPGQRDKYIHVSQPGETYRVDCPFCGDTRQRLYINHRWNDQIGGMRFEDEPYIARCFNENCEKTHEGFREKLKSMVTLGEALPHIKKGKVVTRPDKFDWPGTVIPINELPHDHGTIQWLRDERGFDIEELSEVWGFKWVEESDSDLIWNYNRLIAPIYGYLDGNIEMLGWQTRWYNHDKKVSAPHKKKIPKYLTQGNKNSLLFNGFRAVGNTPVVLCEGTFDAITVGADYGVCTFGKMPSPRQKELLWNGWGKFKADLVIAYDPDLGAEEHSKLLEGFRDWDNVVELPLPDGYDVADFSRDQIWSMIDILGVKKRKLF